MRIIEYDPIRGMAIRDGEAEVPAAFIIANPNLHFNGKPFDINADRVWESFANDLVFYPIRIAILEGRIDYRTILFRYNNQDMSVNRWGNPAGYPSDYPFYYGDYAARILRGQAEQRKAEREARQV